jgi:hypothetical protein
MTSHNKFTVGTRLVDLENAVKELRRENNELRTHLGGQLANLVKDATATIQASLRIPKDGAPGAAGRNGIDGVSIKGDKGERGDCTIPTESELAAAVNVLRLKLAKWQAAVLFQYEQNTGRTHSGLKKAIENTLKSIEQNAQ